MKNNLEISSYIGKLGEDIACSVLSKINFCILDRNWRKNYGEVDIIAQKNNIIHFFEIKSINKINSEYRPEENVHSKKIDSLKKMIEVYMINKKEKKFSFHIITLKIEDDQAILEVLENIIL